MAAVVAAIGVALARQVWKKTEKAQPFWILYQLGFIVLMGMSLLLRSW